jgi:hypothetical protein
VSYGVVQYPLFQALEPNFGHGKNTKALALQGVRQLVAMLLRRRLLLQTSVPLRRMRTHQQHQSNSISTSTTPGHTMDVMVAVEEDVMPPFMNEGVAVKGGTR